jgi:hypothetical protein
MNTTWCKYSGPLSSLPALLAIGCCCLVSNVGRGALETFVLDATNSSLSISGTLAGSAFQQQGTGSLTTKYSGTIKADVTGSNITFVGGSVIVGLNSGNWQPGPGGVAGSAPANYGMKETVLLTTVMAAVRNTLLDVTSSALPLTGGSFPGQGLYFDYPSNSTSVLDYTYSGLLGSGSGSQQLKAVVTNNLNNATLIVQGAELVLTIPVDVSGTATAVNPNDVQYRLRGQFVARTPVSVPLQINTFQVSPSLFTFTIATTPERSYTILGSTNLTDWATIVDQFTATTNPTVLNISRPALPLMYFRVRQD